MKKIFTMFATVLLVATSFTSFAQYHDNGRYEKDRDVVYSDNRDNRDNRNDRYYYSKRDRDIQIANINREYDRKMESVRSRWFTSQSKKQRIMWRLEEDRKNELRKVYYKYNSPANRGDDHDRRRNW